MSFWDKIKSLFKRENNNIVESNTDEVEVDEVDEVFFKEEVTVEDLAEEQKIIDELYKSEGLTDKVLDMQVALNEKRNKYDISDKTHLNKDGWSQ